jgi:hypothetical protein
MPDENTRDADDPYRIDLPDGWTVVTEGDETTYESPGGTRRVQITEFSRGLSLYWWVNVFERDGDDWTRVEVGLGESFTRADAVASAVQSYLDGLVPEPDRRVAAGGERG